MRLTLGCKKNSKYMLKECRIKKKNKNVCIPPLTAWFSMKFEYIVYDEYPFAHNLIF